MLPPPKEVEVLTPGTCECDLIGDRVFVDIIKLRVLMRGGDLRPGEGPLRKGADTAVPSQGSPGPTLSSQALRTWGRQEGASHGASGGSAALPAPRFRTSGL